MRTYTPAFLFYDSLELFNANAYAQSIFAETFLAIDKKNDYKKLRDSRIDLNMKVELLLRSARVAYNV